METKMVEEDSKLLRKVRKNVIWLNILTTVLIALVGVIAYKYKSTDTKLTETVMEISRKTGVEFSTETNSVFGVKVIRPSDFR